VPHFRPFPEEAASERLRAVWRAASTRCKVFEQVRKSLENKGFGNSCGGLGNKRIKGYESSVLVIINTFAKIRQMK